MQNLSMKEVKENDKTAKKSMVTTSPTNISTNYLMKITKRVSMNNYLKKQSTPKIVPRIPKDNPKAAPPSPRSIGSARTHKIPVVIITP